MVLKILTVISLTIASCNQTNEVTNNNDANNFNFYEWVESVTLKKHPDLISFNLTNSDINKSEIYTEQSSPKISLSGDTITVNFIKHQWIGCDIIGNISIEKDTVKLLYCNICPPNPESDSFIEEEVLFKFTYKIKHSSKIEKLYFMPEERDLKIK